MTPRGVLLVLGLLAAGACGGSGSSGGGQDGGGGGADAGPRRDGAGPGGIWQPAPRTTWQWQLTGTIDTSIDVAMYDVDLYEAPDPTLAQLKADDRVVICYLSAGSLENYRDDVDDFPAEAVGNVLDGWPDENWLDVRNTGIRAPIEARLDHAVARGCDGVEPDNVDAYQNDSGFPLTANDQLTFNRWLAEAAHARGLSVGLKNDTDQIEALAADFDWGLNEECFTYDECDTESPFIEAGKAVFHAEYVAAGDLEDVCAVTGPLQLSTLIKRLDLDAYRVACP